MWWTLTPSLQVDKNGTLDYEEFQNLLETIGLWKKMFFKFDQDRSGALEKDEVNSAIRSLGKCGFSGTVVSLWVWLSFHLILSVWVWLYLHLILSV